MHVRGTHTYKAKTSSELAFSIVEYNSMVFLNSVDLT